MVTKLKCCYHPTHLLCYHWIRSLATGTHWIRKKRLWISWIELSVVHTFGCKKYGNNRSCRRFNNWIYIIRILTDVELRFWSVFYISWNQKVFSQIKKAQNYGETALICICVQVILIKLWCHCHKRWTVTEFTLQPFKEQRNICYIFSYDLRGGPVMSYM